MLGFGFYDSYVFEKLKRVSFTKVSKEKKIERLELVHADVWVPF